MAISVALALALFTVAVIVYLVVSRHDPETAASHDDDLVDDSTALFGGPHDRPAGPGAEDDGVAARGAPTPGPSAESLPRPRRPV